MESKRDESCLLETILPPTLEDAGLEDCALPPEAIKEAFFKAANSIRSLPSDEVESDAEDCVEDPGLTNGELFDSLIGVDPNSYQPRPCGTERGDALSEFLGDQVAAGVTGAKNAEKGTTTDRVLGLSTSEGGKKACVDVLQGLKIKDDDGFERDEEEKEGEQPILAEACI